MITKILKSDKLKSMFIYSISFSLNKASMYLLLPLYTRVLSVELYGKYDLLITLYSFIFMVGLLGLDSAILRFYKVDNKPYNKRIFKTVGDVFKYSVLFYIIVGILIYFINQPMFNGSLLILFFFISRLIIEGTNKIYKNKIRMEDKAKQYLFLDIVKFSTSILLSLILVNVMEDKFMAIFLSISFSSFLGLIKYFTNYLKIDNFNNLKLKKEIFRYSFPLPFNSVVNWIFSLSDRILIKLYLSYSALGMYSAGFKLGAMAQFLTFGFGLMWPKWAIEIKAEKDSDEKIEKILSLVLLVFIFSYIFLYLIIKFIYPHFYDAVYQESFKVVPIIILSFLLLGIDMITSVGIFYEKKSYYTLFTTVLAAILNVILNVILIPRFGYYVAAVTTYISNLTLLLSRGMIGYRLFKIKYRLRTILLFIVLNLLLMILR